MRRDEFPIGQTCNKEISVRHIIESYRRYKSLLNEKGIERYVSIDVGNEAKLINKVVHSLKKVRLFEVRARVFYSQDTLASPNTFRRM